MFISFLFQTQCTMPKLRIRMSRKNTASRPSSSPAPNSNTSNTPATPPAVPRAGPPMSLAELSVRLGAQRLRQEKAQARAAAEAAREAAGLSASESNASTEYTTPVSSQETGAEGPAPSQRGPLQPQTYFEQLFDAKTPYFDGPHIPKALRQRNPWVARDPPPKPESSSSQQKQQLQRHQPVRGPRKSPFRKHPKPCLTVCKSPKSCVHSYCHYHNLHENKTASSSSS